MLLQSLRSVRSARVVEYMEHTRRFLCFVMIVRAVSTGGAATSGGAGTPRARSTPPLKIGVLHYSPSLRPFPLLADPAGYNPNTYDLGNPEEREFWCASLT